MSKIDDGGPAFPRTGFFPETAGVHDEDLSAVLDTRTDPQRGMTLRDYFAAAALTGLLAAHTGETALPDDDKAARWAYQAADEMLKRRNTPSA